MSQNQVRTEDMVVRADFENEKFESGAQQTLDTLQELKKSLKDLESTADSLKSLDRAAKSINVTSLADNVALIANRFKTTGIVGMSVIHNLVSGTMNLGKKMSSLISGPLNQIKTGGWSRAMNISNAMFQMGGLVDDFAEQQEKIHSTINAAVSGTAYSYDAAAKAMAQFIASGVEFRGESQDMAHALRGISGVAAQTNSSYEEIANIFTAAAGAGHVMNGELTRISERGLNAKAVLAKALNATETEVTEMASKGKIDFNTFAKAMDDAFGEHATKANETFQGAFDNMKASLSRTGADFADVIQKQAVKVFNAIRPNINLFNKALLGGDEKLGIQGAQAAERLGKIAEFIVNGFTSKLVDKSGNGLLAFGWVGDAVDTIENMALGLYGIFDNIKAGFIGMFPEHTINTVSGFFTKTKELSEGFRDKFATIKSFFQPMADQAGKAADAVETVTDTVKDLDEIARRVIRGDFGNGQPRFEALEKLGYNYKIVQNRVNELLGCNFRYELSEEELAKTQKEVAEATNDTADATAELADKTAEEDSIAGKLQRTGKGIAAFLSLIRKAGSGIVSGVGKIVSAGLPKILSFVLGFTSKIGDGLVAINKAFEDGDFAEKLLSSLSGHFSFIKETVSGLLKPVGKLISDFKNSERFSGFIKSAKDFFANLPSKIDSLTSKYKRLKTSITGSSGFKKFVELVEKLYGHVKDLTASAFDTVVDWFKSLSDLKFPDIDGVVTTILNMVDGFTQFVGQFINLETISKVFDTIGTAVSKIPEYLGLAYDKVKQFFEELSKKPEVQKLKEQFDELKKSAEDLAGKGLDVILSKLTGIKDLKFPSMESVLTIATEFVGAVTTAIDKIEDLVTFLKEGFGPDVIEGAKLIWEFLGKISTFKLPEIDLKSNPLGASLFGSFFNKADVSKGTEKAQDTATGVIQDFIDKIDWSAVGKALKFGAEIYLALRLSGFFRTFADGFNSLKKSLSKVPDSLAGTLDSLGGALHAYQRNLDAKSLVYIAAAIGVLAGAIYALATYVEPDRLTDVTAAIMGLMLGIAAIMWAFSKIKREPKEMAKAVETTAQAVNNTTTTVTGIGEKAANAIKEGISAFGNALKDAIKGFGTGAMFIGFAVFLLSFLYVVKQVYDMVMDISKDNKKIQAMIVTLMAVLSSIVILVAALSVITKSASKLNASAGAGMLMLAVAFGAIVAALAGLMVLVKIDVVSLGIALAAMVGIFAALSVLSQTTKDNDMVKFAAGAAIMAGALLLMCAPLAIMMHFDPKQLMLTSVALGVLFGAFGFASKYGKDAVDASRGLLAMSGALLVFAAAMFVLTKVEGFMGNFLKMTIAMSAFIIVMGFAAKMLDKFKLIMVFDNLGEALLKLSVSMLAFSAALLIFGVALPFITEGLITLGQGLKEHGEEIGLAVAAIVAAIAAGLVAAKPNIREGAKSSLEGLVEGFEKAFPKISKFLKSGMIELIGVVCAVLIIGATPIGKAIAMAFGALADSLYDNAPIIVNAIYKLLAALIKIIEEAIGQLFGGAVSKLKEIFPGVGEKLEGFGNWMVGLTDGWHDDLIKKGEELGAAPGEGAVQGMAKSLNDTKKALGLGISELTGTVEENYNPDLETPTAEAGNGALASLSGLLGPFSSVSGFLGGGATASFGESFDLAGVAGVKFEDLKKVVEEAGLTVPADVTEVGDLANLAWANGIDFISPLKEQFGYDIPEEITANIPMGQDSLNGYLSALGDNVDLSGAENVGTDWVDKLNDTVSSESSSGDAGRSILDANNEVLAEGASEARPYGENYTTEWAGGVEAKKDEAKKSTLSVVTLAINTLGEKVGDFKLRGEASGDNYAGGILSKGPQAKTAGESIRNNALSGASGGYDDMYDIGRNAARGFYDGLGSMMSDIEAKAREMANTAADTAQKTLDERSPSKRFRRLGTWAVQGFIIGLGSLNSEVENTAANMANSSLNVMSNVVSKIGEALSSDLDTTPTIRPVLDLSNIEDGADYINGALGGMNGYIPVTALRATNRVATNMSGSNVPGDVSPVSSGSTYNFTQNNYSPKALSRLEIYRQSRNLFAAMKGQAHA